MQKEMDFAYRIGNTTLTSRTKPEFVDVPVHAPSYYDKDYMCWQPGRIKYFERREVIETGKVLTDSVCSLFKYKELKLGRVLRTFGTHSEDVVSPWKPR